MNLGILRILGILLFVYLTWRNLRENYDEDKIVNYSWVALLGFFVSGRIIYGLVNFGVWSDSWTSWFAVWQKPGINYVGGFIFLILINFLFSKRNSWKFIPFCEDGLINSFLLIIFLMADEFLRSRFDIQTGIFLLLLILMTFFAKFLKKKYRSFVWYKSGKKGFSFLVTISLTFLILGLLGFYFKFNLIYCVLYLVISLISLVWLLILGEVFDFLIINKRK